MQIPLLEGGQDVFRVYRKGAGGPLIVLLHGGGYSALTWSLVVVSAEIIIKSCNIFANFFDIYNFFFKLRKIARYIKGCGLKLFFLCCIKNVFF